MKLFYFRYCSVDGKYVDVEIYAVAADFEAAISLAQEGLAKSEWVLAEMKQLTDFGRSPAVLVTRFDMARLRQMIIDKTALKPDRLIELVKEWLGE